MVTPRLLPLSKRRLNGLMPKLYLLPWRMWWLKQNPSMVMVVWSSAQKCPPTFSTDSYPLQLIVLPGEEIQRQHLPETLHDLKQRDSEVGTSRALSPGISRSDRIKKGSRSTDLRLLRLKKLCQWSVVPSEALKPYRSRH